MEVYQHWLEPAEAQELQAQRKRPAANSRADCKRQRHDHEHEHEERLVVEQRAVDEEL